jgi:AcrR family transcriptional regulator
MDRLAPPHAVDSPVEGRIVEAMLDCISRYGVAKTTADDIARAAGVSRATLYRVFPGGKDVAFEALMRHEARRFFELVTARLECAETVEDLVVTGVVEAARFLAEHPALTFVLAHEPALVMPRFAFHRLDPALRIATAFTTPHLRRFQPDDQTATANAEWLVRVLLSFAMQPTPWFDLTDEASVRRVVTTYVLPVLGTVPGPHLGPTLGPAPKEH